MASSNIDMCERRARSANETIIFDIIRPLVLSSYAADVRAFDLQKGTRCRNMWCKVYGCAEATTCITTAFSSVEYRIADDYLSSAFVNPIASGVRPPRQIIATLASPSATVPKSLQIEVAWSTNAIGGIETYLDCEMIAWNRAFGASDKTVCPSPLHQNKVALNEERAFSPAATEAMPTLQDDFRAYVEATIIDASYQSMISSQPSLTLEEEFSGTNNMARVKLHGSFFDVAGRRADRTLTIDGSSRTVYQQIDRFIPIGTAELVSDSVKNYFFPPGSECIKNVFGYNVMAPNAKSLLLLGTLNAWYMGTATVRGQPAKYWQLLNGTTKVQWFFSTTTNASTSSSTNNRLLRITVEDDRYSFFVHHPFYQHGIPFASSYADEACDAIFPNVHTCSSQDEEQRQVIYDFYGYNPLPVGYTIGVTDMCLASDTINAFPPQSCSRSGISSGSAAMIALAFLLFGVVIGAVLSFLKLRHFMAPHLDSHKPNAPPESTSL